MALLSNPQDLFDESVQPPCIQFRFFESKSPTDSAPLDTVHLYMPEAVSQPSTVSWDNEKFGFAGNAISKIPMPQAIGGGGMEGSLGAVGNAITDALAVGSARALANLGSVAAGIMGGNVSAEGLMGEVLGKIPNPYLTAVFRGVDFRQFAFTFKFYPFREKDCDTIHEIITAFRKNALPSYAGDEGGIKSMLKYPSECMISYMWNQDGTIKVNPWIHKFKRAVCTGIDVDYTGQGMFSTMRNGFPSEITMTTKWTEIEIVTREDIGSGPTQGF
jgi:hypothetical protein